MWYTLWPSSAEIQQLLFLPTFETYNHVELQQLEHIISSHFNQHFIHFNIHSFHPIIISTTQFLIQHHWMEQNKKIGYDMGFHQHHVGSNAENTNDWFTTTFYIMMDVTSNNCLGGVLE